MKLSFLKQTALFRGIEDEALETLLGCLNAREKHYDKGSTICRAGDTTHEIGLVESGSVNSIVNFYWGDSHIFDHMETGEIFGETYAALPGRELLADVVAAEDCTIVFFDMDKLLHTCESACSCHNQIIRNPPALSASDCCPTCPSRPRKRARLPLRSPSPASSWRTIWAWTAARCPTN